MKKILFIIFTLLLASIMLTACGEDETLIYHTVEFDSNGAETYQNRAILDNGTVVEPQNPTRVGYTFIGWYNGDRLWDFKNDKVTENIKLTAKWERITYIIKFDSNGGSAVEDQVVESGNFLSEPQAPTKKDSRFLGWYNGNTEWKFDIHRATAHITLTAKWESFPTYTVTFDSNGGTDVASQYIVEGYSASVPAAPTMQNARFLGWYDGNTLWNFAENKITSDLTLTAKWEAIPTFTVTFNSNGGSAVTPQYIIEGGKATVPMKPSMDGLAEFLGWYNGDTLWNFDTVLTADITLTAKWKIYYTVTFDTNGASDIPSITVASGSLVPPQNAPTRDGFRFTGWYVGSEEWNFATDKVSDNITIKALWTPIPTYTVTFNTDGGSAIDTPSVPEGSTVAQPHDPTKVGYRFNGWVIDGTNEEWDFQTDTVTENVVLKAVWVELVYVTFNAGNGSAHIVIAIDKNTVVTAASDPEKAGFVFRGWRDSEDALFDFNTVITENITLTAYWKKACVITFVPNFDGAEPMPSITVGEGEFLEMPEEPERESKWRLYGWYVGNTQNGVKWDFKNTPVTSDMTLVAKWLLTTPPHIFGE